MLEVVDFRCRMKRGTGLLIFVLIILEGIGAKPYYGEKYSLDGGGENFFFQSLNSASFLFIANMNYLLIIKRTSMLI